MDKKNALEEIAMLEHISRVSAHDNICQYHGVRWGQENGVEYCYLAFERCGIGIVDWLYEYQVKYSRGISKELVEYVARGLIAGVCFLIEDCGVAHRDIKLENLQIEVDVCTLLPDWENAGAVKIIDFGTATTARSLSTAGNFDVGTPDCMPPELLLACSLGYGGYGYEEVDPFYAHVSPRCGDLWAVGIAVYQLLIHAGDGIFDLEWNYGPFQDDANNIRDPYFDWEKDAPAHLVWNELGPEWRALQGVVLACLQHNPKARVYRWFEEEEVRRVRDGALRRQMELEEEEADVRQQMELEEAAARRAIEEKHERKEEEARRVIQENERKEEARRAKKRAKNRARRARKRAAALQAKYDRDFPPLK